MSAERQSPPGRVAPLLALIAAACALGVYGARTAATALYSSFPFLLDLRWAAGMALALALCLLGSVALIARSRQLLRGGAPLARFAAALLPLVALFAVLLRPFPDLAWSWAVAIAVACGVLPAAVRALRPASTCAATASVPPRRPDAPAAGTAKPGTMRDVLDAHAAALLAGGVASFVYLRTMAPSVVAGDSAEFQTLGYTLGIAHPTGYPLYLLLAKAFTFLPFGNVAYRVNLLSGFAAAAAVYLLVLTAHRLSGDVRAALVAGLTFAFGSIFWSQAVAAEVYALNALFVLLLVYLVVRGASQSPGQGRPGLTPYALWPVFGLSLTHHRTALLLAPALLGYVLLYRRRALLRPRAVLAAVVLAALPLSLYLYLPLRWPAVNGAVLDWHQFYWHVLGSGYGFALRPEALVAEPDRYAYFLGLLGAQLSIPGLAVVAAGLLVLLIRRPLPGALVLLAFATFTLFAIAYHVPDVAVFFIPSFAFCALWLASGIAAFTGRVEHALFAYGGLPGGAELSLTLAALIPAFLLVSGYTGVDASANLVLDRSGRAALDQEVQPGAVVVADMLRLSALRYFYDVEAPERRVTVIMPDTEAFARRVIADSIRAGRPVYLGRFLTGLETEYRLSAPGPLVAVTGNAPSPPPPTVPRDVALPSGLTFAGYTPGPSTVRVAGDWHATFYWRAKDKTAQSYYVHLRLTDRTGTVAYSAKPGLPVQGLYPTWAWHPGDLIADYRELSLPADLAPGTYDVAVGLGGAFREPEQWIPAGTVEVSPGDLPPSTRPALALFGDQVALLGYDWAGTTRPGGRARLTLRWQSLAGPAPHPFAARFDLVDRAGVPRATMGATLVSPPAEPGRDGISLDALRWALPGDMPPGTYFLRVRLDNGDGRPLSALSGWPARPADDAVLGSVVVTQAPAGALTNLENKIILVRRVLERDELRPGETLRLTLYWRAVTKVDSDYTVFVHLLDASPRVRAQVDSFPAGGLRPTSQWSPDELVADTYEIPIPSDLPAGDYQIEVGMYLAANMQRLSVIDEEERPVDDRVLVGSVRVRGD